MRKLFIAIIAACGGIALVSGPAAAEGLPQLDPRNYPPQLVWLAISFLLLYLLMSRIALPRVRYVLEERKRRIEVNLTKAESLKADAEEAAAAYEKMMAEARAGAQDVLREAREASAAEAAARHKELGERLEKQISAAEARIADARREAIAGIREVAVDVSASIVGRLIGEEVDAAAIASAVDQTMKESG